MSLVIKNIKPTETSYFDADWAVDDPSEIKFDLTNDGNKFVCRNNKDHTVSNVSEFTRTSKLIRNNKDNTNKIIWKYLSSFDLLNSFNEIDLSEIDKILTILFITKISIANSLPYRKSSIIILELNWYCSKKKFIIINNSFIFKY